MVNSSLDESLHLVADRYRRRILHHLRNGSEGETEISDLVDRVLTAESTSEENQPLDREQVAIELRHVHLPMLEDYGIMEYDAKMGTIRYLSNEQVETVLDSLPEDDSFVQVGEYS